MWVAFFLCDTIIRVSKTYVSKIIINPDSVGVMGGATVLYGKRVRISIPSTMYVSCRRHNNMDGRCCIYMLGQNVYDLNRILPRKQAASFFWGWVIVEGGVGGEFLWCRG